MIVFYSLVILLLVLYLCVQRKFYWLAWKIRGPIGFPFLGNIELLSPENLLIYASKVRKNYKSPLTAWLGPVCFLYISDPANMERILNAPECISKSDVYDYIPQFIGSGLLSSKNPEWSSHRKLLNPSFKTGQLSQFFLVFNIRTEEFCHQLKTMSELEQPLDIEKNLQEYTFSISSETIMGQKCSIQYDEANQIVTSYNILIEQVAKMIFNPLYKYSIIIKMIDSDYYKKIQEAIKNVTEFSKECAKASSQFIPETEVEFLNSSECNFIGYAVKLSRKRLFSMSEVINEGNHLIVASYETTSKALLHIITLLALHPEWQEKLYEEIKERFPDKNAELTFENIQDTPLIDMVIKETLRLLPVIPLKARVTTANFLLFDDVVLPKGTNIVLDIYSMHRDPKYWGADAMHFNPYRFLHDEVLKRHPYVYIPFSKGLRNCIGWRYANLAMKVFIINVFRRFRFESSIELNEVDIIFNISAKLTQRPLFTIKDR